MKWDRETVIAISFIVLSLGSAVYLSSITLNYLNYYPALGTLTAQITSVSVVPGMNWSRIDSRITVSNPSGYSGMLVSEAYTFMFFKNNNGSSLFTDFPPRGDQAIANQLKPHSTLPANVVTRLYPNDAGSLQSFDSESSAIMANVTLTVLVTTFLAPSVGQYSITVNSVLPLAS
jgi:hypothetical protein